VEAHRTLIRRYYEEMWNRWDFDLAHELLAPDIEFQGSLGVSVRGVPGFQGYMRTVQAAFPDFTNVIEELICEGDRASARLTYRGTHRGELFGIGPTGRPIEYSGAAIFRIAEGKVAHGWVLGDRAGLREQIAGDSLEIVSATLADREWAATIMAASDPWRKLGVGLEICRRACCDPEYLVFLAHRGAERCGFIVLQSRGVAGAPYIKTVATAAAFRGQGIGARLIEFAEDHFRGQSRHIFMCVSSFNQRARTLYERLGYEAVGEFHDFAISGASEILLYKRL
jgi:predicted ester cyclase/GNAT superfamily N-acetyltransferase